MSAENLAIENYACPHCRAVFRTAFQRCPLDGHVLEPLSGDPLSGSSFADRYIIEECVGEGGMGRVYRARHQRMSRLFAIKVLFGDHAADKKMQARLAREAESASRLSHPNVISVLDFGETAEGLLYLVMDYVAGPTLARLIDEQAPLSRNRILSLVRDMARGLSHAHKRNLIHRDFKADNVIIGSDSGEEVAKIVDFGIAMLNEPSKSRKLTTEGMVLGTPAVMAPEQAVGEEVDNRTDLFSLGIVLYEMLCGKLPFDGTPMEIARQNLAHAPPRISDRVPGLHVDPELEALSIRLMAKRREDRPQSAKEVLRALSRMTGENSIEFRRNEGSFLEAAGLDPLTPVPAPAAYGHIVETTPAELTPEASADFDALHDTEPSSPAYHKASAPIGLTSMVAQQKRRSSVVKWLVPAVAAVAVGVVITVVVILQGSAEKSAANAGDEPGETGATPPTTPLGAGALDAGAVAVAAVDAAPVVVDVDAAPPVAPMSDRDRARAERERKKREKAERKKREKAERKKREKAERAASLKAARAEQERQAKLKAKRAEEKRKAEEERKAAAAAAANVDLSGGVTTQQFKARFKGVGSKLNELSRLDPGAAAGPKRLYSSVQANFSKAISDQKTRTRFYRTLGKLRRTINAKIAKAKARTNSAP